MKKYTSLFLTSLLCLTCLASCQKAVSEQSCITKNEPSELTDLTFSGECITIDTAANREYTYSGELTDTAVKERLWEIITEQQDAEPIKDGEMHRGTPFLTVTDKDGMTYTVSYSHAKTELVPEETGEQTADYAFYISGDTSRKYAVTSNENMTEFNSLITDYLTANAAPEEKLFRKEEKTDWIVFVNIYRNWAWGYVCVGAFVDCYGNVYEFDLTDLGNITDDELKDALYDIYSNTEPAETGVYNSDELFEIMTERVPDIDRNATVTEGWDGCDMGQTTLYVCDCDFNMIELRSTGDCNSELQDDTARALCKFYDKK